MEKRFSNNRFSASILNKAREDAIPNAIANTGISVQQQAELYQRIDSQKLFLRVYIDYLNVVHSLIFALNENGQDIWIAEPEKAQQAKNIFENLSNPNFPQDKIAEAFIQIIEINPYNVDYHKFMTSKFGETEETINIRNYFGFTNLENPRIG